NGGAVPACDAIKGRVQSCPACQLAQAENVLHSFARPARAVFIFQLHADDRTAILEEESLGLLADLTIETRNILEIDRIIFSRRGFREEPVRQAAVPHLAVRPGTDANPHVQFVLGAELDETAQVALSRPVKLPFDLLVMNPENIG